MSEFSPFNNNIRMLAFVPSSRGTGFAVIESPPLFPIDRGLVSPKLDHEDHVTRLDTLLSYYRPDVMLVEDTNSQHCRRGERSRETIERLIGIAGDYGIAVRTVSKDEVYTHFTVPSTSAKVVIAQRAAALLPELLPFVPKVRRRWDTETHWTPVFEAIALILTALKAD